jgi:MFS family permease
MYSRIGGICSLYARYFDSLCSKLTANKAIGGSCVSDLFSERERANAMAIYSLGPLLAPSIGPVLAGFIVQTIVRFHVLLTTLANAHSVIRESNGSSS